MKRTTTIALVAAIAITMTGCDALDAVLGFNMFESFAAVDADEIADADAKTLVELSDSDSFYDALEGDAALKGTTLDKIDDAMDAADPSSLTYQELAVLAANIHLQTTAAGDLINNVSSLIVDLIDEPTPDYSDLEGIVSGLVPDSIKSADGSIDQDAFLAMIIALEEADVVYQDLGGALITGVYASGTDIVAGEIAQNALLAAVIAAVVPPAGTTGEYLYALLTEPTTPDPDSSVFPEFPDMTSGSYLGNILAAADISF